LNSRKDGSENIAIVTVSGLIENERGSLDRVPSIVRRASSATPVPVVNETFFLLLSGLRLSFKGSSFFGSFGQGSTGTQSMLLSPLSA